MSQVDHLELVFKHAGGVELRVIVDDDNDDVVLWASDSDPEFMDKLGHEIMSAEGDAEVVMQYLENNGVATAEELEDMDIFDESLDGDDVASLEDADKVIDAESPNDDG